MIDDQVTGRLLFRVAITCDTCGFRETFEATSEDGLDRKAEEHAWMRFGPSGQDLCWRCRGASPNTIVQVKDFRRIS